MAHGRKSKAVHVVNGRYEVMRSLGEGARKKVYLAHDEVLDRDVALALIPTEGVDAESRKRVEHGARVMGRLGSHQNIVTVYDFGEEDGNQFVVVDLMEGGDLRSLLDRANDHKLVAEQTLTIGLAISRALEHTHGHDVIHRDVNPSNIWLAADGTAKLGDFELAGTAGAVEPQINVIAAARRAYGIVIGKHRGRGRAESLLAGRKRWVGSKPVSRRTNRHSMMGTRAYGSLLSRITRRDALALHSWGVNRRVPWTALQTKVSNRDEIQARHFQLSIVLRP